MHDNDTPATSSNVDGLAGPPPEASVDTAANMGHIEGNSESTVYTLFRWSPPGANRLIGVVDMTKPDAWDRLAARYSPAGSDRPLARIFEIAQQHQVKSVVIEYRYIDAEWRSQLARFFNGTFRRYPSVCHRLHFFSTEIADDLANLDDVAAGDFYCGYTVLRPFPISPVSKTMIKPPPELREAVTCESTEQVDLIGRSFAITSMPFISQDTQFLRCAHAAMWMVLTHAHFSHGLGRRLPGDIYDAAVGGEKVGRQLPNDGLSGSQLWVALEDLGLSPSRIYLPETREKEEGAGPVRLYTVMRRYLNSSLPPIVTSENHAWVVVAYGREGSKGDQNLTLWKHDDSAGPYLRVDDPWATDVEGHQAWTCAYLPLLPKAYVVAERVSSVAREWVTQFLKNEQDDGMEGLVPALIEAGAREEERERHTYRTYLITATRFKQELGTRAIDPEIAETYRRLPMSRYIWVIEIVDGLQRKLGQPDTIGELLIDATLTQFEPVDDPAGMLAVHIDGLAVLPGIDGADTRLMRRPARQFYESGCPGFPANRLRAASS